MTADEADLPDLAEVEPMEEAAGDVSMADYLARPQHAHRRRLSPRMKPRPPRLPENRYPNVYAWVTSWLAPVYGRNLDRKSVRWCPLWPHHPEAVTRLESAWKAWEAMRLDPGTSAAAWWVNYCDPLMRELLDPEGTFSYCQDGKHRVPAALPTTNLPLRLLQ